MHNKAMQYQQVAQTSEVESASPHKIIQLLMQGAIDRIHLAKGHMINNNIEMKGICISVSISIVDGLKASLDEEVGGEIAKNLSQLYDYMMARLVEANLNNQPDILDEVINLIKTIKEGWDAIPVELQDKGE